MKIVFATGNDNKVKEIKSLLPAEIELLSLQDINCHEDIPETSDTIECNALQKAHYVLEHYGVPCFAEDTGLEVAALNGAPGVYSARYAGAHGDSEANMDKVLSELGNGTDRTARFKTVIALVNKDTKHTFEGICDGEILAARQGDQGFGYDPIFRPIGDERSFAEMDMDSKNGYSHRAKALRQLVDFLLTNGVDFIE